MWELLKRPEVTCLLYTFCIVILCYLVINLNKKIISIENKIHDLHIAYFRKWADTLMETEVQDFIKKFMEAKR